MQGTGKHRYNGASAQPLQDEAAKLRLLHQLCEELGVTIDPTSLPSWNHPIEPPEPIDLEIAEYPPRERPWLVENWLPMHETIGLSGPGGEGKTLIAQMLATAAALGSTWLGLPVSQMRSALILCEDYHDDVLWRQRDINHYFGCELKHLAPFMYIEPRRAKLHNYLAVFDRDDILHITPFFHQLLTTLKTFADGWPLLTILDTKSDVFRGRQNDEHHARSFVRQVCDVIARATNGIVLLIYHPSIQGMREGTGTSGSVQWDAAFRARLYLASPDNNDISKRTLSLLKANHAERGKTRDIQWHQGVFRLAEELDAEKPEYQRIAEKTQGQRIFTDAFNLFRSFTKQPLSINRAPTTLADLHNQQGNTPPTDKNQMRDAMLALLKKGDFKTEETRHNGHKTETLVKKGSATD